MPASKGLWGQSSGTKLKSRNTDKYDARDQRTNERVQSNGYVVNKKVKKDVATGGRNEYSDAGVLRGKYEKQKSKTYSSSSGREDKKSPSSSDENVDNSNTIIENTIPVVDNKSQIDTTMEAQELVEGPTINSDVSGLTVHKEFSNLNKIATSKEDMLDPSISETSDQGAFYEGNGNDDIGVIGNEPDIIPEPTAEASGAEYTAAFLIKISYQDAIVTDKQGNVRYAKGFKIGAGLSFGFDVTAFKAYSYNAESALDYDGKSVEISGSKSAAVLAISHSYSTGYADEEGKRVTWESDGVGVGLGIDLGFDISGAGGSVESQDLNEYLHNSGRYIREMDLRQDRRNR